jgi:hypothetical protein
MKKLFLVEKEVGSGKNLESVANITCESSSRKEYKAWEQNMHIIRNSLRKRRLFLVSFTSLLLQGCDIDLFLFIKIVTLCQNFTGNLKPSL